MVPREEVSKLISQGFLLGIKFEQARANGDEALATKLRQELSTMKCDVLYPDTVKPRYDR